MSETESDRPVAAVRYTLRVPVRTLGEEPILGLKAPAIVQLGELEVTLRSAPPLLVTSINGFLSEAAAVEFLPRVVAALWALVVRWNIAFRASFVLERVTYAPDPVAAGNKLARSFGQEYGPPVDGLAGIEDVVVFPTGKRLRWLGLGDARAIVQTPASSVIPVFTQFLGRSDTASLIQDEKLKTALELFNAYFYEASIRAKFLTLVMILEVLAPVTEKHPAARVLVKEWKTQVEAQLGGVRDNDARSALEALDRELDFRRETSIRQRVRQLARNEFADLPESEREVLERQAVKAYDARGTLIHSGRLPDAELDSAHEQAAQVVRRILSKRLGLAA